MYFYIRHLFLLLPLGYFANALAQNTPEIPVSHPDYDDPIVSWELPTRVLHLQSGDKTLPWVPHFIDYTGQSCASCFLGNFYGYLQFYNTPSRSTFEEIQGLGVRFHNYIPDNTYLVSFPYGIIPLLENNNEVIVICPIDPSDKIPEAAMFPSVATTMDIHFFRNVPFTDIQKVLEEFEIQVLGADHKAGIVTVNGEKEKLLALAAHPVIIYMEPVNHLFETEDDQGRNSLRSNSIFSGGANSVPLDGAGVHVSIGDDGFIGAHIDLQNRLEQSNISGTLDGEHGDQMAGIFAGAGNLDPDKKGIAPGVLVHVFDHFTAIKKAVETYHDYGGVITCTSLADGCNRSYTTLAMQADEQVNEIPALLHVFSAGNAGEQDCNYGAGPGWGNITGGVKMAKNGITVGNVTADDMLVSTSSRGPATDGRIKPDITATGSGQISTNPGNTYSTTGGTSAAAHGAAGVLALLYQGYRQLHNGDDPPSALVKATVLNTAEDLGNPGPDFSFGFGRINAKKAWQTILEQRYFNNTISNGLFQDYNISIPPNTKEVKVLLYWHDAPASPLSSISLVNDLDLKMLGPTGNQFLPYVLNTTPDPLLLNAPAGKGTDHLNNVEQISILNPIAGIYQVNVHGFNVPMGDQSYSLVYEFIKDNISLTYPAGGESFSPGQTKRIVWDALDKPGNFTLEFSTNNGTSWQEIAQVSGESRFYDWLIPQVNASAGRIRVMRDNNISSNNHPFSIMRQPEGLQVMKVCADNIVIKWNAVADATGYTVYKMGDQYMDSILFSNDTIDRIDIPDPNLQYWFAVRAHGPGNIKSDRCVAIANLPGISNCVPVADISIYNISSPGTGIIQSCFSQPLPVAVNIRNNGEDFINNIPLFYVLDNQPVVHEVFTGSIPPGIIYHYQFDDLLENLSFGEHQLQIWTGLSSDETFYNDTISLNFLVVASNEEQVPFIETFEGFSPGDNSSLECTSEFLLSKGWMNERNFINDDQDWKVHQGKNTLFGPRLDQNLNTEDGLYLYLHNVNSCNDMEGAMLSPCINLSGVVNPLLSFWYYMEGNDAGILFLDYFDGATWYNLNYYISQPGNNDTWRHATLPLTGLNLETVVFRFRGITGSTAPKGIAIDNFSVTDPQEIPIASFYSDITSTCGNQQIRLFDNSYNQPASFEWSFAPDQPLFLEGTDANSENPVVSFSQDGNYNVTLMVTNAAGQHSVTESEFIHISNGVGIPQLENFDADSPVTNWLVENPDNEIGWQKTVVNGSEGFTTFAMYVDNHSYNAAGELDMLTSKTIDLTTATVPYLRFDYAYAPYNNQNYETLIVELSDNCGNSYEHQLFNKKGDQLATAPAQTTAWSPRSLYQWRSELIDLSDFTGNNIRIRFKNICGFGNNLYIDNLHLFEKETLPQAAFNRSDSVICAGESVEFQTDIMGAPAENVQWFFADNLVPLVNPVAGPVIIEYPVPGQYAVVMIASNDAGSTIFRQEVLVKDLPVAEFDYTIDGSTLYFENSSLYGISYLWEFSNGTSSTETEPIVDITGLQELVAKLTVFNDCGGQTVEKEVIIRTDVPELPSMAGFELFPNPTEGLVFIHFHYPVNPNPVQLTLYNSLGIVILTETFSAGQQNAVVDLGSLPTGVYHLKVLGEKSGTRKISKF